MKLTRRDGTVAAVTVFVLAALAAAFLIGRTSGHAAAAPAPSRSPVAATSPVHAKPSPSQRATPEPSPSQRATPKPSPKPSVTYSPPSPDGPCPGTWSPSCTPLPSPPDFGAGGTVTGGNETYVPEPGVIDLSGDGSTAVTGITWQSWGDQQAAATGTYEHDDCVPNCAAGTYSKVPAAITLSDPVPDANAPTGRVWGAMTITYGGQVTTWSYPGEWAQGAS